LGVGGCKQDAGGALALGAAVEALDHRLVELARLVAITLNPKLPGGAREACRQRERCEPITCYDFLRSLPWELRARV
jgi:hypothetical protein